MPKAKLISFLTQVDLSFNIEFFERIWKIFFRKERIFTITKKGQKEKTGISQTHSEVYS